MIIQATDQPKRIILSGKFFYLWKCKIPKISDFFFGKIYDYSMNKKNFVKKKLFKKNDQSASYMTDNNQNLITKIMLNALVFFYRIFMQKPFSWFFLTKIINHTSCVLVFTVICIIFFKVLDYFFILYCQQLE